MRRYVAIAVRALACLAPIAYPGLTRGETGTLTAEEKNACIKKLNIEPKGTDSKGWKPPDAGRCKVIITDGHRFPDRSCTPGALNPTITEAKLRAPEFKTDCIRDMATSQDDKKIIYTWYGITEDVETCEMDHFVSLEIGGADTLDNIWPQCGPAGSTGDARDFSQKDKVEDFLGAQVKLGAAHGGMSQQTARERITRDWTALIAVAQRARAAKDSKGAK